MNAWESNQPRLRFVSWHRVVFSPASSSNCVACRYTFHPEYLLSRSKIDPSPGRRARRDTETRFAPITETSAPDFSVSVCARPLITAAKRSSGWAAIYLSCYSEPLRMFRKNVPIQFSRWRVRDVDFSKRAVRDIETGIQFWEWYPWLFENIRSILLLEIPWTILAECCDPLSDPRTTVFFLLLLKIGMLLFGVVRVRLRGTIMRVTE